MVSGLQLAKTWVSSFVSLSIALLILRGIGELKFIVDVLVMRTVSLLGMSSFGKASQVSLPLRTRLKAVRIYICQASVALKRNQAADKLS